MSLSKKLTIAMKILALKYHLSYRPVIALQIIPGGRHACTCYLQGSTFIETKTSIWECTRSNFKETKFPGWRCP